MNANISDDNKISVFEIKNFDISAKSKNFKSILNINLQKNSLITKRYLAIN